MKLKLQRYDQEHEDVPLEECENADGAMVLHSDVGEVLGPYLHHTPQCVQWLGHDCTCELDDLCKELER